MPMIPKPMTDINSESAYEKLKFVEEHYNDLMAAYTDIMEHLKLPVMTDTGGGGSGGDCLHEVVEVTNPCPAYVQFDFNVLDTDVGFQYSYKDIWDDYSTTYIDIKDSDKNSVTASIVDALRKYNREHPNNAIDLSRNYTSDNLRIFPKPINEHSGLDYTVILLDKTTGEPVKNMNEDYKFDGYEEVTYDIVSEMYDIKLALIDKGYYYNPIILGDFYEKLVELRNSINTPNYLSKLPTPEEFGRLLNLRSSYDGKIAIKLLTEEERTEVRRYIQMNTSSNVPPDTSYMYALDLFCHPSTLNETVDVSSGTIGSYSKGYIDITDYFKFGRNNNGCGDNGNITYIHSTISLTPFQFSSLYTYFKMSDNSNQSTGAVVMPQTFKLIQSKEGIDRRL